MERVRILTNNPSRNLVTVYGTISRDHGIHPWDWSKSRVPQEADEETGHRDDTGTKTSWLTFGCAAGARSATVCTSREFGGPQVGHSVRVVDYLVYRQSDNNLPRCQFASLPLREHYAQK